VSDRVRSWGTRFADTRLIPRSCVSVTWHVPNEKLSSLAISMIVMHQFPQTTALTRSTVSLVHATDGRPVCGLSSMDVRSFIIRNTTQISWTDSTLFPQMLVVAFRTFLCPSYQVSGRT
jgi:cytosine/uracil/thiamine/allantoin permease